MKTSKLVSILSPLQPCFSGVESLKKYTTVGQWFSDETVRTNYKVYLWLTVACADAAINDDDTYLKELYEFIDKNAFGPLYVYRIYVEAVGSPINALGVFRLNNQGLYYPGYNMYVCKGFTEQFRCPTDR